MNGHAESLDAGTTKDAGMSLVELVVAILISGIVLAGIATILARYWQTQDVVVSVTESTANAQMLGAAVERAVRNGLFVQVSADGSTLWVRTSLGGQLKCQGFHFTGNSGAQARFSTSSGALGDASTWPVWQAGARKQGSANYFTNSSGGVVSYRFEIVTESAPVKVTGSVKPRSPQEGDNDSCWS